jgi:hypothetical protein
MRFEGGLPARAALLRPWSVAQTHPWAALLVLGTLSAAVWGVGLLLPYNVWALDLRPLRDIAKLTRGDPAGQAAFVLTFAALSALYYAAWRLCRGRTEPAMWRALILGLAAANFALLWLYPIGAADVFDNIVRGRITAVYGGNPYYETPRAYRVDAFYRYSAWPDATSAYGPVWELMAAGLSRLAGHQVLANLLAHKLAGILFYAGCAALIARLLGRYAPGRTLQGVCLFAWNPLVLYETAGNGHNDIVMVFLILLGLEALSRRRPTLGALAFMGGALVKFIPVLLVPIALADGWRARAGWQRWRFLTLASLACAALALVTYGLFLRPGQALQALDLDRRATLFTTSLPAFVQAQLELRFGEADSGRLVGVSAAGSTVLAALLAAWWYWREAGGDWLRPVRAVAGVLLFYLLITCLWFQAWYAVWPVALAALLPEGALARLIVLLSYSALWKSVVFNVWLYPGGPLPPRTWRETWLGPATLGLAWAYGAYALVRQWRLHLLRRRGPVATRRP